jgi:hypothetical protein
MTSTKKRLNIISPGHMAARRSTALTPKDTKLFLEQFRVHPAVLQAAQLRRLTNKAAREKGFSCKDAPPNADLGGTEFPNRDAKGKEFNARIRHDHPEIGDDDKEKNKYLSLPTSKAVRRGFYILPEDRARLEKNPTLVSCWLKLRRAYWRLPAM